MSRGFQGIWGALPAVIVLKLILLIDAELKSALAVTVCS